MVLCYRPRIFFGQSFPGIWSETYRTGLEQYLSVFKRHLCVCKDSLCLWCVTWEVLDLWVQFGKKHTFKQSYASFSLVSFFCCRFCLNALAEVRYIIYSRVMHTLCKGPVWIFFLFFFLTDNLNKKHLMYRLAFVSMFLCLSAPCTLPFFFFSFFNLKG